MLVMVLAAMFLIPTQATASHMPRVPPHHHMQGLDAGSPPGAFSTSRRSVFGTIRRIAKCAVHIGGFVVGNAVAISKLRKAGGVWKVATRTWKAQGSAGKLKVLSSVFGEIIGLNTVVEACGA